MPSTEKPANLPVNSAKQHSKEPSKSADAPASAYQGQPESIYERATQAPQTLTRQDVLHLQRTMGNRAVSGLLGGQQNAKIDPQAQPFARGRGAFLQRKVLPLNENPNDKVTQGDIDKAKKIAGIINTSVKYNRAIALDWRQFEKSHGYLKTWYDKADEYMKSLDDDEESVSLLHARFGYAIETLACADLPAKIDGLNIALQVAAGATRPDIVITLDDGSVVAWLDITSKASEYHVKNKSGSGWHTHPYVAEILYDTLDPEEVIKNAGTNPFYKRLGEYQGDRRNNRQDAEESTREMMIDEVEEVREKYDFNDALGDKKKKQKLVKKEFKQKFGSDYGGRAIDQMTVGILKNTGMNPGHFGYKGEGVKQKHDGFKKLLKEAAQPGIDIMDSETLGQHYTQNMQSLKPYQYAVPEAGDYMDAESGQPASEGGLRGGMAQNARIEMIDRLRSILLQLRSLGNDPGHERVGDHVNQMLMSLLSLNMNDHDRVVQSIAEADKIAVRAVEYISNVPSEDGMNLDDEKSSNFEFY